MGGVFTPEQHRMKTFFYRHDRQVACTQGEAVAEAPPLPKDLRWTNGSKVEGFDISRRCRGNRVSLSGPIGPHLK
ncbi:hypothetical protein D1AOALGA4SA_4385 [Olavius algarvensis Delta 1 endosymbiont]|nr:hypothetical protein D1AOALGA4SA_4385 [Olavius algarvensis Delta 1 endosymbiont]